MSDEKKGDLLIGLVARDKEDGEVFNIKSYKAGWYELALRSDERITQKSRRDEFDIIEPEELESIQEEEDDEELQGKMSKQLAKYRQTYVASVASSGKKSLRKDDQVAEALEYKTLDEVYKVAGSLLDGWDEDSLRAKYAKLNPGAQRMNLGNRLRAAFKKGVEPVVNWVEDNLGDKE